MQFCIVYQVKNSLKYLPWNHYREFSKDLKQVFKASSFELAEYNLDMLEQKWGKQHFVVIQSWRTNWKRLSQYFKYPEPIRKLV